MELCLLAAVITDNCFIMYQKKKMKIVPQPATK